MEVAKTVCCLQDLVVVEHLFRVVCSQSILQTVTGGGMEKTVIHGVLVVVGMIGAISANACDKSYAFRVDVSGSAGKTICDSKATTFVDSLQNFNFSNLGYTDTSAAVADGRFSDVNIRLSYSQNSRTLSYNFVELGDSGSFTGATRNESQKLLEDYIKKHGIIGKIMKYQAQHSASSPITGAGGLIPMTIAGDFNAAFSNSPDAGAGPKVQGAASNNLIGANVLLGSYNVDGSSDRITYASLPLSYTIRNGMDPRSQLTFSLPITVVKTGDAQTAQTGLGLSYRIPLTDRWSVTPAGKYSVVASVDRATVSTLYSASLSSVYVIPMSSFDVAIGNMVGYYKTGKFASGDYSFNPDITNVATRNGVMVSHPVQLGRKMTMEYTLVDTRYFGDKPFLDAYQELGVSIGTNKSALDARSFFRGGIQYMRGQSVTGIQANIGFWF